MRWVPLCLVFAVHATAQTNPLTVVSAATYKADALAAEMLASGFSALIRAGASYTVAVADASGTERPAQIAAVAEGIVNFVLPASLAAGTATVQLRSGNTAVTSGTVRIAGVAPGLFTANSSGSGAPAGKALVVRAGGERHRRICFFPIPRVALCPSHSTRANPAQESFFSFTAPGSAPRGR